MTKTAQNDFNRTSDDQDHGMSIGSNVATDLLLGGLFGGTSFAMTALQVGADFRDEYVASVLPHNQAEQNQYKTTFRPSPANDTSYARTDLELASNKYNFTMYQAAPVAPDMPAPAAFYAPPAPAMRMGGMR